MELRNLPTTGYTPTIDAELAPLVDPELKAIILGRSKSAHEQFRSSGTLEIGAVCEKQSQEESFLGTRVLLDAQFPHVMFICGKRGSGKSYTLGVIAEELARSTADIGTVIVDPIGIFWSMRLPNRSEKEREKLGLWGLKAKGFKNIQVLTPIGFYNQLRDLVDAPFSIATQDLSADDWCLVFDINRFKAQGLLIGDALEKVSRGYTAIVEGAPIEVPGLKGSYNIGDVIQCLEHDVNLISKKEGYATATRRSVVARFRAAASWGLFTKEGTPLSEISKPNRVTILDISHPKLGDARRSLVVGILARKILESRIETVRWEDGLMASSSKGSGEHPWIPVTWLLIDEAHVLLPHIGRTAATDALIEYAKIGRKPGCALVLATQRPAATNDDILSQVDFLIGHNLALEEDMKALRKRVPAMMPKEFTSSDFLRGLPVGIGVVADQKTQKRAMLLQIRPRLSHHAGKAAVPTSVSEKGMADGEEDDVGVERTQTAPLVEEDILEPTLTLADLQAPKKEEVMASEDASHSMGQMEVPVQGEEVQLYSEEQIAKGEGESDVSLPGGPMEGGMLPDIGFDELADKTWGSFILVKGASADDVAYNIFKRLLEHDHNGLSISRKHPEKVKASHELGEFTANWLSKSSDPLSVTPMNLGKVAHNINSFLKSDVRQVVILEGLEYLVNNNDFTKVLRLIEDLHEKTIKHNSFMLIPVNPAIYSKRDIEMLQEEVDQVLDIDRKKEKRTEARAQPAIDRLKESQEQLIAERKRLEEERERLLKDQERRLQEERARMMEEDMRRIETQMKKAEDERVGMVEKEKLRLEKEKGKIIDETKRKVEKELGRIESARKKLLEDQKKSEQNRKVREKKVRDEEARKRKKMDEMERNRAKEMERRLKEEEKKRLDVLEAERKRFEAETAQLTAERERLEMEKQKMEEDLARRKAERLEAMREEEEKEEEEEPEVVRESKVMRPPSSRRKRSGLEKNVVEPRLLGKEASAVAERLLERTLLGKRIEHVESITSLFLPLLRMETRTMGGLLFSSERKGEVLWDMVTGEMITDFKSGLRRTKGLCVLFDLNDTDAKVLCALKVKSAQDATDLIEKTGMSSQKVKRSLTSLKKSLLVAPGTKADTKQEVYTRNVEIRYPRKIDTRAVPLPGISVIEVSEEVLEENFSGKQIARVLSVLSPKSRVTKEDVILYPVFFVEISGKKGDRSIFIDAVAGKEDKVLTETA